MSAVIQVFVANLAFHYYLTRPLERLPAASGFPVVSISPLAMHPQSSGQVSISATIEAKPLLKATFAMILKMGFGFGVKNRCYIERLDEIA